MLHTQNFADRIVIKALIRRDRPADAPMVLNGIKNENDSIFTNNVLSFLESEVGVHYVIERHTFLIEFFIQISMTEYCSEFKYQCVFNIFLRDRNNQVTCHFIIKSEQIKNSKYPIFSYMNE